jgi:hypothetical protein
VRDPGSELAHRDQALGPIQAIEPFALSARPFMHFGQAGESELRK